MGGVESLSLGVPALLAWIAISLSECKVELICSVRLELNLAPVSLL